MSLRVHHQDTGCRAKVAQIFRNPDLLGTSGESIFALHLRLVVAPAHHPVHVVVDRIAGSKACR
ncbi:MAG TPA: hypothetical protein VMI10_11115 [Terriglobales bacterium]|nr:hypothetical protein [Terriglobales bacterium]